MAQGIRPGEKPNAREIYGDIIDLPAWEPNAKHPRMALQARAAQFAPYAALTGYHDLVEEEARLTGREIELTDEEKERIRQKLDVIQGALSAGERPEITVEYFVPDPHKAGGSYTEVTARIRRIDAAAQKLILFPDGRADVPASIAMERIASIRGEIVSFLEE